MSQVLLESLSGILLSLVGFYMMLGTKFQQHPYPLIGFACLVHGGYYFSQVQFLTVCYFNVFNRVEYRRGFFDSMYTSGLLQAVQLMYGPNKKKFISNPNSRYRVYIEVLNSWTITKQSLMMLQVFINCLIFVDLYLTLRNPFFPRKRRMFFYYLSASIIFILVVFFISMDLRSLQPDQLEGEMMKGHNTAQMVMFGYTVTLILLTVIPTFLVIRRLLRKGTSRQLKRKVVQRHLMFFLIYCIALIQMIDIQTEFIDNWL